MQLLSRKIFFIFLIPALTMFLNISLAGGNRELMQEKKLKTLLLNETVIEQINELNDNALVSFVGRVVKRKDGSVEILVEQLDKKPLNTLNNKVVKKSNQRYIQYISFEEMQKLPKTETYNDKKSSNFYGGGAAIK